MNDPSILTGRCKRCEFVTPCDCPCHEKCETCDGSGSSTIVSVPRDRWLYVTSECVLMPRDQFARLAAVVRAALELDRVIPTDEDHMPLIHAYEALTPDDIEAVAK